MSAKYHHVYILQSIPQTDAFYYGYTSLTPEVRLANHNAGKVPSTKHKAPWKIVAFISVNSQATATELEKFLKSGSGRTFVKKRLLSIT